MSARPHKTIWPLAAVLLLLMPALSSLAPQGRPQADLSFTFSGLPGCLFYGARAVAAENPSRSKAELILQLNQTFQEIAEQVTPTVVSITSSRPGTGRERSAGETVINMGSGVIVSAEGYVLTSNHVIEDADKITVILLDGRSYRASVIGADYTTDLAVLKVDYLEPGARLPVVRFGDSDSCRIGAWVLTIGNPMDLGLSVTAGIISAKSRKIDALSDNPLNVQDNIDHSIESFIQTDAVINPGNSGGALVNLRGELIGINTAIASQTGLYQGYGFAIPVNLARRVMEDLITLGRVVRPMLGVLIQNIDPVMARALGLENPQGVLVEDFVPKNDSPAELGGLRRGDVIISVGGYPVNFSHQLQETIAKRRPGETVELTVIRDRQRLKRLVKLGKKEISGREIRQTAVPEPQKSTTFGMGLREITEEDISELGLENNRGVVIDRVDSGELAYKAGLMPGDVILEVNRQPVNHVDELRDLLDDVSSGTALLLLVLRGGTTRFTSMEVP
ncbi:MAG TPA: trypsin-like peptidase domain-containing protein [archaeon]|nr:trypsin-like peptidase domain-containing protein [archaeon]